MPTCDVLGWDARRIRGARSRGGVLALESYRDNLLVPASCPWPPPEVLQKLYRSEHVGAFDSESAELLERELGYYCDLQSANSEDALTWNLFGPLIYGRARDGVLFAESLLRMLGVSEKAGETVKYWLWRRVPHPETYRLGGPEIDFGIACEGCLILGEAKWLSGVQAEQGIRKNKTQIELRHEFLVDLGPSLYPECRTFVVLGVGPTADILQPTELHSAGRRFLHLGATWRDLCSLDGHPSRAELLRYLKWKGALANGPAASGMH